MFTDLCLVFDDKDQSEAVLYTAVAVEFNELNGDTARYRLRPDYRNIDVIGTLYDPPETEDGDPVALPGWHVNVRLVEGESAEALEPFVVTPENPRRVWA